MPQTANLFSQFKTGAGKSGRGLLDAQGAQDTTARHGKYFTAALAGAAGMAANQAAITSSVALATTNVGFTLSNPAGSGKNLVIQKVGFALPVAAAAGQSIGLFGGFSAGGITGHTTPITIQSGVVGASVAALVAKADAACTLVGTPAWLKWLASNLTTTDGVSEYDIDGEIIIPPGGYVGIGTLIASGASGFLGAMSWEELGI